MKRTHNSVTFEIQSFPIEGAYETKTKYQAFWNDNAITDIEGTSAEAIMRAIYFINTYPWKF